MATCQSSEGCGNKATHWVLIEYSWPMLPKEMRTYLLCESHMKLAQKTASNQMARYPETGIRVVEYGRLYQGEEA